MSVEQNFSGPMDDNEVVVTYSRVPKRRGRAGPPARRELRPDPEFSRAGHHDAVDASFVADDLRAERQESVDAIFNRTGRPDYLRYGLVGAVLAVVAGLGVLATSVGIATMVPGDISGGSSNVAKLAEIEPQADIDATSGPVREIPLGSGAPASPGESLEQAAIEVAPPIPRPRPEVLAAAAEPAADDTITPPSPSSDEPMNDVATAVVAPSTVATSTTPVPSDEGTDGLITSIEETLARVDANRTSGAAGNETDAAAAQTVAPPVLPAPADEPPSVVMTQPVHPPPGAGEYPPYGGDPLHDVLPPPAAGDVYIGGPIPPEPLPPPPVADRGYPGVPVPPEPVPQAYPPGAYIYYGPGPGVHPRGPYYVYPQEAEARRPGLLRRGIARAGDAVVRVFSRD